MTTKTMTKVDTDQIEAALDRADRRRRERTLGLETASRETIDELNRIARARQAETGATPYDALMGVVRMLDVDLVAEDSRCRVYRLNDGRLINLWVDAPGPGIEDGGLGFDDQVEWASE